MGQRFRALFCLLGLVALSGAATAAPETDIATLKAEYRRPAEAPPPPDGNAPSFAKIRLGWTLFQDRRLSRDETLACVDCHRPELGWQDGLPRARGQGGHSLRRRTPSLFDAAWGETFFWDGRAPSLEVQALMPVQAADEMNQTLDLLVERLQRVEFYRGLFADAFPQAPDITADNVAKAIAAFERTIISGQTPFDRWVEGDDGAIGASAKRGFVLFNGKANCAACHSGWRLTDDSFHDIGLPAGADPGRGPVINVPLLEHAFKTPSLRNVAARAPYMHDGSVGDLREVVDHYADGIVQRPTLSDDLKRITLTDTERDDLVAFLKTLTLDQPPQSGYSPLR